MAETTMFPRDVCISPPWTDPDDSQRLWGLGVSREVSRETPVILTRFRGGDGDWYVNWALPRWDDGFGVTPARVKLWSEMLAWFDTHCEAAHA